MFEEAMKRYLRKRGYKIRRGRKPSSPLLRAVWGGTIGSMMGYLLDRKTMDSLSRLLADPSTLMSVLTQPPIPPSCSAQPRVAGLDDELRSRRVSRSKVRSNPFVGMPKGGGYKKIGSDPMVDTQAYVAPEGLLVSIRDEDTQILLSADEVTDLLDMIGEAMKQSPFKKKPSPAKTVKTFGGDESDVEAAEEAFGWGTPAAQAVKGYRRVKPQAPIHKDCKAPLNPYAWNRVSYLVEAAALQDSAVVRVRFEGGDSGYVDMTKGDIECVKLYIKSGTIHSESRLEMKKVPGNKVPGLVVVADPDTKHAVELDLSSIKLVEDIFDLAYF